MIKSVNAEVNEHMYGIRIGKLAIYNVYKYLSRNWTQPELPVSQHPTIYIGDFNSHSTEWELTAENEDEGLLLNWTATNRI